MDENISYYDNTPELLPGGKHGFKKVSPQLSVDLSRKKFFATPLGHPLSRMLEKVKRKMDRYMNRESRQHYKNPVAMKEEIASESQEEKDLQTPLPRKTTGGTGSFMGVLRYPYVR